MPEILCKALTPVEEASEVREEAQTASAAGGNTWQHNYSGTVMCMSRIRRSIPRIVEPAPSANNMAVTSGSPN